MISSTTLVTLISRLLYHGLPECSTEQTAAELMICKL